MQGMITSEKQHAASRIWAAQDALLAAASTRNLRRKGALGEVGPGQKVDSGLELGEAGEGVPTEMWDAGRSPQSMRQVLSVDLAPAPLQEGQPDDGTSLEESLSANVCLVHFSQPQ